MFKVFLFWDFLQIQLEVPNKRFEPIVIVVILEE